MTYAFSPPRPSSLVSPNILIEVARCWRAALTRGESVQPCLYRILNPHHAQILAPVLDSLLRFYERALGHALTVGTAPLLTQDEAQLLAIMDGSLESRTSISCSNDAASGLDRAVKSARIMMRLAAADR